MPELGTGDVFEVRVYGEEDLSGNYQVSSDGSINFPLAGRIEVDGMTAHQVANALSESLKNFIKNPSVSVYVKEYQSKKVMVFGGEGWHLSLSGRYEHYRGDHPGGRIR